MAVADRIHRDLQGHFADRLHELLLDSADTMLRADIKQSEIVTSLLAALLREICGAAWSLKLDEDAFLTATRMAYREYLPQYRKLAKQIGK